jgi:uncharacterized SAM-binding protein YcdF (DUF218 family)
MKIRPIKNIIIVFSLIINLIMAVIFFTPLTEELYKPLLVNEPLRKSEAIIVLSGDGYSCGVLGMLTMTRINKALEVYRDKWADEILCVGGKWFPKINKSISEVMKEYLILYGIPEKNISVCDETNGTYYDINYMLKKFDKRFNFNNAIFVTSSFHTYRVKRILQKQGIKAIVVSAEQYELYPNFWATRFDLFKIIVREYLAIFCSKIKGWI